VKKCIRKEELEGLTGIRFYAAFFVYLSHLVATIPGMEAFGGSFLIFNAGVVSVSFFFLLSGFILTYNYVDVFGEGISASDYTRFLLHRLARIYPVHLLATLLVIPIALLSPNLILDWRAVPVHVLLFQSWWPSATPPFMEYLNVPSWALSCEWFFYVVAPVALYGTMQNNRHWVVTIAVLSYMLGLGSFLAHTPSDSVRLYFVSWFAPSRFIEFLVGMYLARLFLSTSGHKVVQYSKLAQAIGILLLIMGAIYRQYAPWPLWGGLLYLPGSALLVVGLASGKGFFIKHLGQPWLHRLGVSSFSFYMIHAPVIRALKGVCRYLGWEVQSWVQFWAVTWGAFVFIQVLAVGVCFFYELPLQRRFRAKEKARVYRVIEENFQPPAEAHVGSREPGLISTHPNNKP